MISYRESNIIPIGLLERGNGEEEIAKEKNLPTPQKNSIK